MCNKKFYPYNAEREKGGGKFCSEKCYFEYRKNIKVKNRTHICRFCKKTFYRDSSHQYIYCSQRCFGRDNIGRRLSPKTEFKRQNGKRPYPKLWTEALKSIIRDRDNHRCTDCGCPESENIKNLDVHHIDNNKNNNELSNLISLCMRCHRKRHNYNAEYMKKILKGAS
jgi:hypothetical protein